MARTLSILLLHLLAPIAFVVGKSCSPRAKEVELMKEELSLVKAKLIRVHPEPFHVLSREDFEENTSKLQDRLAPMPVEQWYQNVEPNKTGSHLNT